MMRPVADTWVSAARGLSSSISVQRVAAGASARYAARRRARMWMVTTIVGLAFGVAPLLMRIHGARAYGPGGEIEAPSALLVNSLPTPSGQVLLEARGSGELIADASNADAGFPRD